MAKNKKDLSVDVAVDDKVDPACSACGGSTESGHMAGCGLPCVAGGSGDGSEHGFDGKCSRCGKL